MMDTTAECPEATPEATPKADLEIGPEATVHTTMVPIGTMEKTSPVIDLSPSFLFHQKRKWLVHGVS
jgi:hypothetical protein